MAVHEVTSGGKAELHEGCLGAPRNARVRQPRPGELAANARWRVGESADQQRAVGDEACVGVSAQGHASFARSRFVGLIRAC